MLYVQKCILYGERSAYNQCPNLLFSAVHTSLWLIDSYYYIMWDFTSFLLHFDMYMCINTIHKSGYVYLWRNLTSNSYMYILYVCIFGAVIFKLPTASVLENFHPSNLTLDLILVTIISNCLLYNFSGIIRAHLLSIYRPFFLAMLSFQSLHSHHYINRFCHTSHLRIQFYIFPRFD